MDQFRPEHASQLGFNVALVDEKLRNPDLHAPTIGLLLCATRSDAVVRYALANSSAPMAVADCATQLSAAPQRRLPSPEEFEAIVDATLDTTPEAASE